MLVSIQVASGVSNLKTWGIQNVAESFTVHKVYVVLRNGTMEGSEYFKFSAELRDQLCRSFVGKSQTAEFQTVVVTAKIGELLVLFGQ